MKISSNLQCHRRITAQFLLQTNALGAIDFDVGTNYPFSAPAPDFASMSALYESYRVISMRCTLIPRQAFTVTNSGGVLVAGSHFDGFTGMTTIQRALESTDRRIINVLTPDTYTFTLRPRLSDDAQEWSNVTTALLGQSLYGTHFLAAGLSVSTIYFDLIVDFDCLFANGC
jgi:hypothetical protein